MSAPGLRLLDRADVVALGGADFTAAVTDVRDALALLRAGTAEMPPEVSVRLGTNEASGRAYALPAALGGHFEVAGVKWTAHRPEFADGAPAIVSVTLTCDRRTGLPCGLVESALLTAMRSAAVSALALEHLAPGPVRAVAVLGAGMQARTHLHMLAAHYPTLDRVLLWNRTGGRATALAGMPWPFPVEVVTTPSTAIAGSDAVLACTDAPSPILEADAVAPGRLVVQVGRHEASFEAIDRADHVVVDLWGEFRLSSAKSLFQMHRAGRFPAERVSADLAAVVLDGWRPRPGSAVYMSSFGLNIFDVALAARILDRAEAEGRGATFPLRVEQGRSWPWT